MDFFHDFFEKGISGFVAGVPELRNGNQPGIVGTHGVELDMDGVKNGRKYVSKDDIFSALFAGIFLKRTLPF